MLSQRIWKRIIVKFLARWAMHTMEILLNRQRGCSADQRSHVPSSALVMHVRQSEGL